MTSCVILCLLLNSFIKHIKNISHRLIIKIISIKCQASAKLSKMLPLPPISLSPLSKRSRSISLAGIQASHIQATLHPSDGPQTTFPILSSTASLHSSPDRRHFCRTFLTRIPDPGCVTQKSAANQEAKTSRKGGTWEGGMKAKDRRSWTEQGTGHTPAWNAKPQAPAISVQARTQKEKTGIKSSRKKG